MVAGATDWLAIAAKDKHTCGIRGDGGNGDGTGGKGEDGAGDWSSFAAPDAAAEASAMPVYARSLGAGDGIDIRV